MSKYIQKLIHEQFSISDLDFSDDSQEYSANIFNKNIIDITKIINGEASEDEILQLDEMVMASKPVNKDELKKIATLYSNNYQKNSMNWVDVSEITDMSYIFNYSHYYGDISRWDVSNVTNMSNMFANSKFDGIISDWNVSSVTNMYSMFDDSSFNKDISKWDVSNVMNMSGMFAGKPWNWHKGIMRIWKLSRWALCCMILR